MIKRMTESIRKEIVTKAISEGRGAGFGMMSLAPKSQTMLEKKGVKTKSRQELKSLLTTYKDKFYIVFFIDGENTTKYAVLWELISVPNKYSSGNSMEGKFKGYIALPKKPVKVTKYKRKRSTVRSHKRAKQRRK